MPPSRVRPSFRQGESSVSDKTLFAIVGDRETRPDPTGKMIEISRVLPDPSQPRKTFPPASIDQLAASIAALGFLQPVVVRRVGADYMLISGERRYRAALQLGLQEIPAVIRDFGPEDAAIASLIENLQRENIPPDEEAAAFDELLRSRQLGVRELARLIHKDPSYVSRRVRVYEDPELGMAVRAGQVAVSTAERILGVRDPLVRAALLERAQAGDLDQKTARDIVRSSKPQQREMQSAADFPSTDAQAAVITQEVTGVTGNPVADVFEAIDTLIGSNVRLTAVERQRLRIAQERLYAWLGRQGLVGW